MAIVTLTITEGRDQATLERLHRALAEVVIRELPAAPHRVRTIIQELKPAAYAVGGVALSVDPEAGGTEPPSAA